MTTLFFDASDDLVRFYLDDNISYSVLANGDIKTSDNRLFTGITKENLIIQEKTNIVKGFRNQYKFNNGTIIENVDFIEPVQPNQIGDLAILPQTITIDLLGTISDPEIVTGLLQYQDEFDKWVAKRPTLQALLNKGTVTFDKFKIDLLRQIINTDKDSAFNPLSNNLATILLGLLDQLESKIS